MPALRMLRTSFQVQLLMLTLMLVASAEGTIIQSLLRNNVAGPDINFQLFSQKMSWPFDPDAGQRLRTEYQRRNGVYGWKAVERIGLGEDGLADIRQQQQKYRDSIGALAYKVPGWDH